MGQPPLIFAGTIHLGKATEGEDENPPPRTPSPNQTSRWQDCRSQNIPAPAGSGASSSQETELEILRRRSPIHTSPDLPAHPHAEKVRELESQQVASSEAMSSLQDENKHLEGTFGPCRNAL